MKYRIRENQSICVGEEKSGSGEPIPGTLKLLSGPQVVDASEIPAEKIKGFLANGSIEKVTGTDTEPTPGTGTHPPGPSTGTRPVKGTGTLPPAEESKTR